MKRLLIGLVCLLLLCPASSAFGSGIDLDISSAPLERNTQAQNGMVRVYLSSMGNLSALDVTVVGSYSISGNTTLSLSGGDTARIAFNKSSGQISLTVHGQTYALGQEAVLRRHVASGDSGLRIAQGKKPGNLYPGDLRLVAKSASGAYRLYPIVYVYIESYLKGVLPYEMGDSAGGEALKAQAVAARTYTLNKMNTRANQLYDVVDTTNDQVYYGNSDTTPNCAAAVEATKGIVLMNDGALTSTFYTASNGGQTESARNLWGSSGYDYLSVKDDPFDKQNAASVTRKTTVYADNTLAAQNSKLAALLNAKAQAATGDSGARVTYISAITPHSPMYPSPSRLYTKLDFDVTVSSGGASRQMTLTCDIFSELETLLGMSINTAKNELWSVEKSGVVFTLYARRFGHGIGMSQRGAMQMSALGYTYDEILGFYYSNSYRMQHVFTHTILDAVSNGGGTITTTDTPAVITPSAGDQALVSLVGVNDYAPLRYMPSSDGKVLTSVPNGSAVTVLARQERWTLVRLGQINGYIETGYLSFSSAPPISSDAQPTDITRWALVSCSGSLNLRTDASLSASVAATIPNGSALCVFTTSGSWAQVQYGARVGWVSTDFLAWRDSYPGKVSVSQTAATVRISSGSGTVNLRETASTSARVLAALPHGSGVTVLANDGSWCYVSVGGMQGYIMTKFLSFGESVDLPTDPPAVTPAPDPEPPATDGTEAIVHSVGGLNLRAQPSLQAAVLAVIPQGESIRVTDRGASWCAVRYGGLTGHVMTQYLTFPGDAQSGMVIGYATVTTSSGNLNLRSQPTAGSMVLCAIPKGARVSVLEQGTSWTKVIYNGKTGYAMSCYLTMESGGASATGTGATVNTASGGLNLRDRPSSDAKVLLSIPRGTRLTIERRENGWSKTSYQGIDGYVMEIFLRFDEASQPSAPSATPSAPSTSAQTATVHTGGGSLNMREEASDTAAVITSVANGAQLTLIQYGETWSYVRYQNIIGYVATRFIRLGGSSAAETATVSTQSGGLNLREQPIATARVLKEIPRGTQVTVTSRGNVWSGVQYGNLAGFVMTKYLAFSGSSGAGEVFDATLTDTPGRIAQVTAESGMVNLRQWCALSAQLVATMPIGELVSVQQTGTNWCKIVFRGQEGYCMTKYLTMLSN